MAKLLLMLLTTALYCLLLTLTWVCTHTCTHTHTRIQAVSQEVYMDIAPDDWIKGDDFFSFSFLLIRTLYNDYKFLLSSEKERRTLFI